MRMVQLVALDADPGTIYCIIYCIVILYIGPHLEQSIHIAIYHSATLNICCIYCTIYVAI
jgi:hypothetical protein